MYYNIKLYNFLGFFKSSKDGKKYYALLQNKQNKRKVKVHFGASSYKQYKDSTGKGSFSHLDHLDEERRKRYRARHIGFLKKGYYSPGYFSYNYLW
jgi:hypothetical protein